MKKRLIILSTVFVLLPGLAIANDDNSYSGHRIAAGVSNTVRDSNYWDELWQYGTGFHLGYGYDFNKIVAINIDYDSSKIENFDYAKRLNAGKLSTELGYAFVFNKWALKPFASVGVAVSDLGKGYLSNDSDALDASLMLGFGLRAELANGLLFELKSNGFNAGDNKTFVQSSLSIGYKF